MSHFFQCPANLEEFIALDPIVVRKRDCALKRLRTEKTKYRVLSEFFTDGKMPSCWRNSSKGTQVNDNTPWCDVMSRGWKLHFMMCLTLWISFQTRFQLSTTDAIIIKLSFQQSPSPASIIGTCYLKITVKAPQVSTCARYSGEQRVASCLAVCQLGRAYSNSHH